MNFYKYKYINMRGRSQLNLQQNHQSKSCLFEFPYEIIRDNQENLLDLNMVLKRAVIGISQLQTLILRFSPPGNGHVHLPLLPVPTQTNCKINLQSLEHLRIAGSSFGNTILDSFTCSNLRVLELRDCGNCSRLFESLLELTADLRLRTLGIIESSQCGGWIATARGIQACETLIISLGGLEEITLEGYGGADMACITRHYRTLRKLTWIERTLDPITKARALAQIRDGCTNLRSLRISEDRERLHTVSIESRTWFLCLLNSWTGIRCR